jgi:hypothetical protein
MAAVDPQVPKLGPIVTKVGGLPRRAEAGGSAASGAAKAGFHIGFYPSTLGDFERAATGAGIAFIEYLVGTVAYSLDGTSSEGNLDTDAPYIAFTDGLFVKGNSGSSHLLTLSEA